MKHLDLKYYFVCENIEKNLIGIEYRESEKQQADILTKALAFNSFSKLKSLIGLKHFRGGGC